jgi:hypothetical protein
MVFLRLWEWVMQDELYVPCPPMRIMPWPARAFLFFTPDREGEFDDSGLIKVAEVLGNHVVELLLASPCKRDI